MVKSFLATNTAGTNRLLIFIAGVFLASVCFQKATAQSTSISIKEALQKVQDHLPELESFRQHALAEQQNIRLAKNSLVPELTVGYQANLATFNNITGMSYPGFLLPISGPPSANNDMNFVTGSAAGALIKWNPISFGQRSAAIEKAAAEFKRANVAYDEQLFQYQYKVINIYLEAVYYKQLLKSVRAAIERNNVGLEQSLVLAKNGLRPGIDTVQFQSAIAQTEIDLLKTERSYQESLNELGRLTGLETAVENIQLTDTVFSRTINFQLDTISIVTSHPYYRALEAQKNITSAGLKEIQKSWVPQLDIWGNLYARGSGIDAAGNINKGDGFNLSRTNAGVGVQLSFPVLQYSKVNISKKQYRFLLKADEEKLAQAKLDINKQTAKALQQYRQDIQIAARSPVLLKAATDVYNGLKISYELGLIDYTRLSQSQYELLKAEVNDANSRLQLWRSLLAIAVAKGNLNLFADQLK